MIAARVREDENDYKKLLVSAPSQTYHISGESECTIYRAWVDAHKAFIMLGMCSAQN